MPGSITTLINRKNAFTIANCWLGEGMNSNELAFSVGLLTYEEVFSKIHGHENHLLLGNGFNISLGVKISYSIIFQKMIDIDFGLYKEAEPLVKKCGHDLE